MEIAYNTRASILNGKKDTVSILRACLAIANNLDKRQHREWILSELQGYGGKSQVPNYRKLRCRYSDRYGYTDPDEFHDIELRTDVHTIDSFFRKGQILSVKHNSETWDTIEPFRLERILSNVVDRCLFFLNDAIKELQYGGIVQNLIEEIRNDVDEKLSKLNENIRNEIDSIHINLSSNNPTDWTKVAHSCRGILKFMADIVFSSKEESYEMKNGRKLEIKDSNFINRLCAFVDSKMGGNERKLLIAEMEYLESYLRQVVGITQMGEHAKSISKFTASMIATHTYLITNEILSSPKTFAQHV